MKPRLKPEQITQKQKEISEKKKEVTTEEDTHKANLNRIKQLKASILETKELLDKMTDERSEVEINVREAQRKIFFLKDLIKGEEKILADDDYIKKVDSLMDEQIGFYEMVKKRLKKKQEDLLEGMEDFLSFQEPESVVKHLEKMATRGGFGALEMEVRATKQVFEEAQRNLCEQKIQGRNSPPSEAIALRSNIDSFLEKPVIMSTWSNS